MNYEDKNYNDSLWRIVNFYPEDRLQKLCEEAGELASVLEVMTMDNEGEDEAMNDDRTRHNLVDEMVDVQIMIDQVRRRFKIGDDEWNLYRDFKLRRQDFRMARSGQSNQ